MGLKELLWTRLPHIFPPVNGMYSKFIINFMKVFEAWFECVGLAMFCFPGSYNLLKPQCPISDKVNLFIHLFIFLQRHQWFNGWGSLHVWNKVLERHPTVGGAGQAGRVGSLGPGGKGRLPVTGELTSGGLISYQGNQSRGTPLMPLW